MRYVVAKSNRIAAIAGDVGKGVVYGDESHNFG
jgi:hypothetical protein